MDVENNNQFIQKLIQTKGEVRGVTLKTDFEFILKERGEEGVKKFEEELKKLGFSIKYKEIQELNYYPAGLRIISLLVIKKIFGYKDNKIREMGARATKISSVLKFFIKYIPSLKKMVVTNTGKVWQNHWTIGTMIPAELNEKEKYAIFQLKDFNLHPIYCRYLEGYITGLFQLIVTSTKITCHETKCSFKGDAQFHEYLVKWQ